MPQSAQELERKILELLDEHRVLTIATQRSDGWPQATMVGYVRDGLTLYFASATDSQKVANIARDPRVSIAIGHEDETRLRGLSMAASAEVVDQPAEIERVNELLRERYHEEARFSPRETAALIVRATPSIISIIDLSRGPGEPQLVDVLDSGSEHTIGTRNKAGVAQRVTVRTVRSYQDGYRPGAP
jgi:PPOX class probable F420-dependent enzyme